MIRLIAMDMDGTLLAGHPATLPAENALALREAAQAGIHLTLASGRLPDDAGFFAVDADMLTGVIALNGGCAMLRPMGELLWSWPFAPETAAGLNALFAASGVLYAMFGGHTLWVSDPGRAYDRMWGTHLQRSGTRVRVVTGAQAAQEMITAGVNKLVALGEGSLDRVAPLRAEVAHAYPEVNIAASWFDNIEVNPAGVSKGAALLRYAALLGIEPAEVMAIGDEDNDISMLRAAGVGVAMGNASTGAKAAADWLTLPNDQAGVAAAIRHLALGEAIPGVKKL